MFATTQEWLKSQDTYKTPEENKAAAEEFIAAARKFFGETLPADVQNIVDNLQGE